MEFEDIMPLRGRKIGTFEDQMSQGAVRAGSDRNTLRRCGTKMTTSTLDASHWVDTLSARIDAMGEALSLHQETMAGRLAVDCIPLARKLLENLEEVAKLYRNIDKARTGWMEKEEEDDGEET